MRIVTLCLLLVGAAATAQAPTGAVLITGANRGLGLELAKQYAARGWSVIATTRNPRDSAELNELAASDDDVTVETLDVRDAAQLAALAAKYRGAAMEMRMLADELRDSGIVWRSWPRRRPIPRCCAS